MIKRILAGLGLVAALGIVVVSVFVERESRYSLERLGGGTDRGRALILYHPSRDAHFSDDLSLAFAQGLMDAGFSVDRATLTSATPARPEGYALIGVVSNTYYWSPDLPTLRYLGHARLEGISVVGIIGGAGSTGRSERLLGRALRASGAIVLQTRSFWLWRPNDESRLAENNRGVAIDLAKRLGMEIGAAVAAGARTP